MQCGVNFPLLSLLVLSALRRGKRPKWGTSHNQMLGCLVCQEVVGDKSQAGLCWGEVTPLAHVIAINHWLCEREGKQQGSEQRGLCLPGTTGQLSEVAG